MSNPILSFMSNAGVAQPANSVPVGVSPNNPLPVTVVSGGGGSSIVVDTGAAVDNQSNTLSFLNNSAADPNLLLGVAQSKYDPITGLWYRDQGLRDGNVANYRNYSNIALALGANATLAAPGAGLRIYVTSFQWFTTGANTGFLISAGTTLFNWPNTVPANQNIVFQVPLRGDANTALNVTTNAAGGAINIQAFIAP
jgi:hypothetical protein